ncbi:ADP-ribosylglycohydrolase family protein [Herbiconiux sp. CPCC 205763]|uniref:ADP-ribosylglycohydrolase family protein n=1 Tax=Herbiconiux aconitum TaxID=2970913 RepID=A0ABT2GQF9_9MICO|nr:ADP-ribosylglycohydrolase family protein [Herbiconiux aconitum]MCS5718413.1 ADP-ribosylglycohydrolase family protein [Herbiconiux aconitum]
MGLRLSWSQPEDLVPHAFRAAELDGVPIDDLVASWTDAGGPLLAPVNGATPDPAPESLRELGRGILSQLDERAVPDAVRLVEPDELSEILALAPGGAAAAGASQALLVLGAAFFDRVHGAWLGRAAGCLLGKPVEKIPREGIRAIAQNTGNWPISSYFTEIGLDPALAERYPWNRKSRPTSLIENIDGMPEDDDLNFPLIALDLLERIGASFSTDDVAQSWLANLPGGRVFTAERIAYRNLLDGYEPSVAGAVRNPFRDWIGAQIRTDVYGWANPGDPVAAARLAFTDARLSHGRNGVYGAMFAAAACSAAVVAGGAGAGGRAAGADGAADAVDAVIAAGLSVVPADSRYAQAIALGASLGRSALDSEEALDRIYAVYGELHWVHVLNNAAVLAFALTRGAGDYEATITAAVTGGWDTDSVGATAGSLAGALLGASALPSRWISPLHNRLASSVPGFDGIGFDELARRTVAVAAATSADAADGAAR